MPTHVIEPTDIQAVRAAGHFAIEWSDDRNDRIPFAAMRRDCPCAACVSELTGERLLDPATVADSIEPIAVELAGNYALKVRWSDGHDTGLFTWPHLRRLGAAHASVGERQ